MNDKMPQKKVINSTVGAAVSSLVIAVFNKFGVDLGPEIGVPLTTITVFLAGYFKNN